MQIIKKILKLGRGICGFRKRIQRLFNNFHDVMKIPQLVSGVSVNGRGNGEVRARLK